MAAIRIFDTHTHLYLPEFKDDNEGALTVERAIEAGVERMMFPNVDVSTITPMKELAAKYPSHISMAMGLHPTEVEANWNDTLAHIQEEISDADYKAIGEIGIDLYWDKTFKEAQMQVFDQQLAWAQDRHLPVIIHCRDGLDETLEVLSGHRDVEAIFHSFGGNPHDVERIRNVGDYYFGINGIVTFKNCNVRNAIPEITTERLLLETDAPYLAPVPHRGKRNESAFIVNTAQYIADYLEMPLESLCEAAYRNALKIFQLK